METRATTYPRQNDDAWQKGEGERGGPAGTGGKGDGVFSWFHGRQSTEISQTRDHISACFGMRWCVIWGKKRRRVSLFLGRVGFLLLLNLGTTALFCCFLFFVFFDFLCVSIRSTIGWLVSFLGCVARGVLGKRGAYNERMEIVRASGELSLSLSLSLAVE